jgi:hypothetical protein
MGVSRCQLYVIQTSVVSKFELIGRDITDRGVRVPAEDAEESGLAADQVKIKEKYGGGFPANVEGLHHLHCLV